MRSYASLTIYAARLCNGNDSDDEDDSENDTDTDNYSENAVAMATDSVTKKNKLLFSS